MMSLSTCLIGYLLGGWLSTGVFAKWVEGHIDTKENWAFLSRFCFLSMEGQFEYLIEYDKDMGMPNLLLYHDHESQWPTVYKSSKSCKEKEAILDVGRRQMVQLSHWYPEMETSGCVIRKDDRELPAVKSTTLTTTSQSTQKPNGNTIPNTTAKLLPKTTITTPTSTKENKITTNKEFYPTTPKTLTTGLSKTTKKNGLQTGDTNLNSVVENSTEWFEVIPTDELISTTEALKDEWEAVGEGTNVSHLANINDDDVEVMFSENGSGRKRRSTIELYERYRRRNLNAESSKTQYNADRSRDRLIVSCHKIIRFTSARPKWWFIAISNCDSVKGLKLRYKFLMTNGPDGDFWHEHFSADEFYVLPILIAFTFAYVCVNIAVVMCSVELKSRHLLHCTYKLFLLSITLQHLGVTMMTLAYLKYGMYGFGGEIARVFGQFLSGMSEMTFLLLLILMAKGYTITRGRLKVSFTVKLTVFMCCYFVTYIVLFVYEAKCFDPGEVLYLYDGVIGYCLIALRILGWCAFAYATFFTVNKFPEKNMFYAPFFICGSLWFYSGPIFILTANYHIDKWVRESVVIAVLLFIAFCGHVMFLLLTLPVFANKNFPYHVRTTQIGIMEITNNAAIDNFGHNPYQPTPGAAQTVIIPLTRRTEELIGSIYTQYDYIADPPNSLDNRIHKLNGTLNNSTKQITNRESIDTNSSDEIKPTLKNERQNSPANGKIQNNVFTIEKKMAELKSEFENGTAPNSLEGDTNNGNEVNKGADTHLVASPTKSVLPPIKPRRSLLEPIRTEVPSWSLAKGPSVVAVLKKEDSATTPAILNLPPSINKKVPPVKNGLSSSGEISTIHEGHMETFTNNVSKATVDLFCVNSKKI